MPDPQVLLTGLAFPESPRWHDGRLWFANWGTGEVIAVDANGVHEIVATVDTLLPYSIDWLPDGRMLIVSGPEARVLRQEPDGRLVVHAELGDFGSGFNEIVVDAIGNAYVNGGDFDPTADRDSANGVIVLVAPDGSTRQVADGIVFGNGMVITEDGSTLIVAESWANRLSAFDVSSDGRLSGRRVWADLEGGYPDGICMDSQEAIWYADVPNKRCVRVVEGGAVLETVDIDRGAFSCVLGGSDGQQLFVAASIWRGFESMISDARDGRILVARSPATTAGQPVEN
jgi:sugar lactone lactonase YvrE